MFNPPLKPGLAQAGFPFFMKKIIKQICRIRDDEPKPPPNPRMKMLPPILFKRLQGAVKFAG